MPELPDVEVFKEYFDSNALKKKIEKVKVPQTRVLESSPAKLRRDLEGEKFSTSRRHGKYLLARLSNDKWLVFHFGMTGFLRYYKDEAKEPKHVRLVIDFANGDHLAYVCQRMFGEVEIVDDDKRFIRQKEMGPDAWAIQWRPFRDRISARTSAIKSTLMTQDVLAGIGNVYADEILYQAKVNPKKRARKLDEKELRKIYNTMGRVLKKAIEFKANPDEAPRSWLLRRRKPGAKCPRCKGEIKKYTVSGRAGYFCPECQQ